MSENRKVVLVVIDGWGFRPEKEWNAIAQARTPNYSRFLGMYPNGRLASSGTRVGVMPGIMGNSEVGHTNIGAGRRVVQDQVRIHEAIDSGEFRRNAALTGEIDRTKNAGRKLHLLGLVSQGDVHSAERHYLALIEMVKERGFPMERCFVHALLDGRDTPPKSAEGYLATLEAKLRTQRGRIATVGGRYYAMDRDKRWERIDLAYRAFVLGEGEKAPDALTALRAAYARGETDEFVKPTVVSDGRIEAGDGLLCFNFRADRMRQIVRAFANLDAPVPSLRPEVRPSIATFTRYDETFPFPVAFPPQSLSLCLGEVIAARHWRQFRTAETEKYAHVTYFLNGGREEPFPMEDRLLVQSPKIATYDLQPEMSSVEVTDGVVKRIEADCDRLIAVNYAQSDMVGHTGIWDAAIAAVEATDRGLGRIVEAAMDRRFHVVITADHGNIELMRDPTTGEPHTAHTTNPVPILVIGDGMGKFRVRTGGALCDVAPTVLTLLEAPQPPEMTGESLLIR
jgi:2,3-bisphosphoglycerate-independent phosphoglycerate mutase